MTNTVQALEALVPATLKVLNALAPGSPARRKAAALLEIAFRNLARDLHGELAQGGATAKAAPAAWRIYRYLTLAELHAKQRDPVKAYLLAQNALHVARASAESYSA